MRSVALRRTALLTGAALLGATALTACGSTSATSSSTSVAPASSPAAVALDEHANRTTVHVALGATVRVDLHSAYWSQVTSSAPDKLIPAPAPSPTATPSCRPGMGCGTVTSAFTAKTGGTVQLTAGRTSCGEAKPCTPDEASFTVTVEIS